MSDKLRWGILGAGSIARKFAEGLTSADGAELTAVGSRQQESADAFGDEFGIPHRHASYQALADDADVDAIYVATPHTLHRENSILCLEAGKAVLCEKPFAINAEQAREAVDVARARGVFLMEAMWTRFFPIMYRLRELLAEGAIGEVRMVAADFGFRANFNPEGRLLNPHLGGGGLLDVGVYAVSLASMVLGRPTRIASLAEIGTTGVDEQAGMVFGYDGGQLSMLYTAARTNTPQEAVVMGTDGRIALPAPWWRPQRMTLIRSGQDPQEIVMEPEGNGYNYEAVEVARCLAQGKTESDVMPLDESIEIMETMDQVRAQWGLKYPME
jgi:predicted dehydrogenase